MSPLVSVVIPARDERDRILSAVDSVLAQTLTDLEVVVVDDGSRDGTAEVVRAAAARDPRVRLVANPGRGISMALNAGVAAARSAWIARLDADDACMPHRLQRQLQAAREQPAVVMWGSWAYLQVDATPNRSLVGKVGPTTIDRFHHGRRVGEPLELLHPTVMVRRDVLEAVGGYDPRFDGGEDVELFDRIGERGPVLSIPEPLVRMRLRREGYGTVAFRKGREAERFVRARMQARLTGTAPPTIESFRAAEESAPVPVRCLRRLREHGSRLAWQADIEWLCGHRVRAAGTKIAAALLDPQTARRVLARLTSGGRGAAGSGRASDDTVADEARP